MRNVGAGCILTFTFLALLLLTGCAPTLQYPRFPDQSKRLEDPTKARVYLLRPGKVWAWGVGLIFCGPDPDATGPVFDPSQQPVLPLFGMFPHNYSTNAHIRRIGEVGPGGYICWETTPHAFPIVGRQGDTNSVFTLNLAAGNVYYLQAGLHPDWLVNRTYIKPLTEAQGQALLKKCNPPDAYRNQIKP